MTSVRLPFLLVAAFSLVSHVPAFGWGEPHHAITRASMAVLPQWQKELLGAELAALGDNYCLIPDNVYTDKENAKFARLDSQPDLVYVPNLHLPAQQPETLETLRFFIGKSVTAFREGKPGDGARYMGTICHLLEDYGSPSHTVPGDNMFTLLQQFLPPTEVMQGKLMHGPIENGDFTVSIDGYQPVLLGTKVDEAAWRIMHRVHEGILNARSTTIPIMQALYADDKDAVVKHQMKAAQMDAKVVADACFTILSLGAQRFDDAAKETLKRVPIGALYPVEAASLYYPQSQFFGSPNWGHPTSGVVMAGGDKATPIKLRMEGAEAKVFGNGISAGMGRSLTFLLPKDVYKRFTVFGGLQMDLGDKGRVEFTISGDGKELAKATVNGTDPARALECDLSGVSQLQLTLTPRGVNAKSNYAVWADPVLEKR